MKNVFDVIVIGLGAMGSSACCHLARRGLAVLGVDQHSLAHDRGSSHGETRLIRKAYFEKPDYVPLLCRAFDLWTQAFAAICPKGSASAPSRAIPCAPASPPPPGSPAEHWTPR